MKKEKVIIIFIVALIVLNVIILVRRVMNNNTNNVKDENKFINIKTYNKDNFERYKKYSEIHSDMSIDEVVKNVNINIDYNFYETDFKSINLLIIE